MSSRFMRLTCLSNTPLWLRSGGLRRGVRRRPRSGRCGHPCAVHEHLRQHG